MSSPRPSWRPLLAAASALFLVILALLAGQVKAGSDPAIGRGTASTQPEQPPQQAAPPGAGDQDSSDDDDDEDEDEDDDGFIPDGLIPDGLIPDGSQPAPSVPGSQSQSSSDAPTTHQS